MATMRRDIFATLVSDPDSRAKVRRWVFDKLGAGGLKILGYQAETDAE